MEEKYKMKTFNARGWWKDSWRHMLAARGISTKYNKARSRKYQAVRWKSIKKEQEGFIIKNMTPDEFLKKTKGFKESGEPIQPLKYYVDVESNELEPTEVLAEKIRKRKKISFNPPYVYESTEGYGFAPEHEGRHRVLAAKLAGEKTIPVIVERPESHKTPEIAREFIKRSFPREQEGDSYYREWMRRFEKPEPMEFMGSKYRKIYQDILREKGLIGPSEEENISKGMKMFAKKPTTWSEPNAGIQLVGRHKKREPLQTVTPELLEGVSWLKNKGAKYEDVKAVYPKNRAVRDAWLKLEGVEDK